jgi:hypothetical protein
MRKHVSHIATALSVAGLAFACTGRTDRVENERVAQSGGVKRGTYERVTLQGCLQKADAGNEYVLRNVVVPPPAAQPQDQETMAHGLPVANGSWVRLTGGSNDLNGYLGKRVAIWGEVVDRGDNTLGTSGRTTPAKEAQTSQEKFEQSSKDAHTDPQRQMPPTTAAPVGADANGMAPRIAVERVNKVADSCDAGTNNNPLPNK